MRSENLTSLGIEYHKESQRIFSKMLLFATLLLVSHALTIKPSEFDAGGVKIAIDDVVVVHGAIAFAFWYYLFMEVMLSVEGTSFIHLNSPVEFMKARVRIAKRRFKTSSGKFRFRTPSQVKRLVRRNINVYMAFVIPFILVFFIVIIGAIILGAVDAWLFTVYLFTKSGAYVFVDSALDGLDHLLGQNEPYPASLA